MREKHGEFIHVYWDCCGSSEVEYVRGHVSIDEAKQALKDYGGPFAADGVTGIKHRWARWVPAEHFSEFTCLLYTYDEKQKGAFAVTEVQLSVFAAVMP